MFFCWLINVCLREIALYDEVHTVLTLRQCLSHTHTHTHTNHTHTRTHNQYYRKILGTFALLRISSTTMFLKKVHYLYPTILKLHRKVAKFTTFAPSKQAVRRRPDTQLDSVKTEIHEPSSKYTWSVWATLMSCQLDQNALTTTLCESTHNTQHPLTRFQPNHLQTQSPKLCTKEKLTIASYRTGVQ